MIKKNQKKSSPQNAPPSAQPSDKRLGRMVMLSGLLHAVILLALVSAADPSRSKPRTPQSYTVSLVAPAALGPALSSPPAPKPQPSKVEVKKPQVEAKKPKVEPKKPQVEAKKPKAKAQPPKVEAKKPKRKPAVAKPKEPVKIAAKKKPPPKKAPAKKPPAQKPEHAKQPPPKKPEEQGTRAEDREQQIVAALERVRQRLRAEAPPSPASGGQAGGDTLRGLPFILYIQEVKQRVKQSWIVAEPRPGLTAVVRFGILASGEIVEVELAERSGDTVFDESAIRAVRKASPLSPPPAAYRNEFTRQKVEVIFGET